MNEAIYTSVTTFALCPKCGMVIEPGGRPFHSLSDCIRALKRQLVWAMLYLSRLPDVAADDLPLAMRDIAAFVADSPPMPEEPRL